MKLPAYFSFLLALGAAILVAYLSLANRELLERPFALWGDASVPLWVMGVLVFLAGFLPPATSLFVRTVRRDLAERAERRQARQEVSADQALRRAFDFEADSQLGKALEQVDQVVAEREGDFAAQLLRGRILRHLGRTSEALEVHRAAAELFPGSVALQYELAADYEAEGKQRVADEVRARVAREYGGRGVAALRSQRSVAISVGDWSEATRLQDEIDALLAGGPDEEASHRDHGQRVGLAYQRGVALLEEERLSDAALLFERILVDDPSFIPARIMLGEVALISEDESAALAAWRRGFEDTGNPVFLQRIEDYLLDEEEPLRAIEVMRSVIALAPDDLLPRFFLGRLYYRLEMLEDADKVLAGLEDRIEELPTYHYLFGRIRERRGEIRRAAMSYRTAVNQLGVRESVYRCRVCVSEYDDWRGRCGACGSWNAVELGFEHERLFEAEQELEQRPIFHGHPGPSLSIQPSDPGPSEPES